MNIGSLLTLVRTSDMYFWLQSGVGGDPGIPALHLASLPATQHTMSESGGGVAGPTWPEKWQGDYFFYHHTHADTMSILDIKQMDRAGSLSRSLARSLAHALSRALSRALSLSLSLSLCVCVCVFVYKFPFILFRGLRIGSNP